MPMPMPMPIILSPIKVIVNGPEARPIQKTDGAFEDTMFLIELIKHQREKDLRESKDKRIHELAMAQKKKMQK